MTTDDFRAKCRRTKEILQEGGVDIAAWARSRGFRPQVVRDLLDGRASGDRGMAREVALALGLIYPKADPDRDEFWHVGPAETASAESDTPPLEVSWKKVGDLIDKFASLGFTPEQFAATNGYAWWMLRPIFVHGLTPKSSAGRRFAEMFKLLDEPQMPQHLYPMPPARLRDHLGRRWPGALHNWLASDGAPDVVTIQEILQVAVATSPSLDDGQPASGAAVFNWVAQRESEGVLKRTGGVYLNSLALKKTNGFGLAHGLNPSAVVSMWSVLIEQGIMDGPPESVSSIVAPKDSQKRSQWRPAHVDGFLPFHFYEIDKDLFEQVGHHGPDSLDARYPFAVATPERALMDWFAVRHRRGPGWVQFPPLRMRLELMDARRLDRLASAMGMDYHFAEWKRRRLNVLFREQPANAKPAPEASAEAGLKLPDSPPQPSFEPIPRPGTLKPPVGRSDDQSLDDWASNAWPD